MPTFSEVVAAGTAAALVPIKSITMGSKGDKFEYIQGDEPGPACMKLLTSLQGVQRGKVEDAFGWRDVIQEAKGYTVKGLDSSNGKADSIDNLP